MGKLLTKKRWIVLTAIILWFGNVYSQGKAADILSVSENGRYLIDSKKRPVFLLSATGWWLLKSLNHNERLFYLNNMKAQGFNTISVWMTDVKDVGAPFIDDDISKPNEEAFKQYEWLARECAKRGMMLNMKVLQDRYSNITDVKARAYGLWLGKRFKKYRNIVWTLGGDFNPDSTGNTTQNYKILAESIKETDPKHKLYTFHAARKFSSLDVIPDNWVTFNFMYSGRPEWRSSAHPYKYGKDEYLRNPPMPFFLGEGIYEREHDGNAATIRREAYWTILSGGCGYSYGNGSIWDFDPDWKTAMNDSGAINMRPFYDVFTSHAWHTLVPDFEHTIVTAGYGTFNNTGKPGGDDYVTTARSADGKLIMSYIPPTGTGPRTLTLDMGKLSATADGKWYNPTNGIYYPIPGSPFSNSGSLQFTTPGNNGTGTNDWVLILEAKL